MARIDLKNVYKKYDDQQVITDLNLHVNDGEFFVLLGPSGAGKTTTLKMISGVEPVTSGTVEIDGRPVNELPPEHRNVAMVFETYALYPHLTVFDNMAFPLRAPKSAIPEPEITEQIRRIAKMLQITQLLDRKPAELSGGQKQRVALGRALVRQPHVFLLDEPLSHLDAKIKNQMRGELKRLRDFIDSTILYVTHDYDEALALADRVAIMHQGQIQCVGHPVELYNKPPSRLVGELLGDPPMNFIEGRLDRQGEGAVFRDTQKELEIMLPSVKNITVCDVILGIRPQHVLLHREPRPDTAFQGKVYVSELMGDYGIVSIKNGHHKMNVLVQPEELLLPDVTVYGTLVLDAIQVFSQSNGENILNIKACES